MGSFNVNDLSDKTRLDHYDKVVECGTVRRFIRFHQDEGFFLGKCIKFLGLVAVKDHRGFAENVLPSLD